MMKTFLFSLLALCVAVGVEAQPYYETQSFTLISQRPDADKAVRCVNVEMKAGCSAFTASTVNVVFPRRPPVWVQFRVEMAAQAVTDQVRLRAFRWVQRNGEWATEDFYWPMTQPMASLDPPEVLLNAPRSVGYYIDPEWWAERSGQWTFVLEFVGSPTIFSAQIIEVKTEPMR